MKAGILLSQSGESVTRDKVLHIAKDAETENKDSILRQFDINQINDYFPEFKKEMKK